MADCVDIKVGRRCCTSDGIGIRLVKTNGKRNQLGTPALDNTSKCDLFWIISNESYEVINDASEMSIRTPADNRLSQA